MSILFKKKLQTSHAATAPEDSSADSYGSFSLTVPGKSLPSAYGLTTLLPGTKGARGVSRKTNSESSRNPDTLPQPPEQEQALDNLSFDSDSLNPTKEGTSVRERKKTHAINNRAAHSCKLFPSACTGVRAEIRRVTQLQGFAVPKRFPEP